MQSPAPPNNNSQPPQDDLEHIFDDLCSRFLINIPGEELTKFERIFFQVEQAHWFYLDFYRENNPKLPKMNLKEFSFQIFVHCPFLKPHVANHSQLFQDFIHYKVRVPVYGAIIINEKFDKVLMVKGWGNKTTWGFPKGKINKDEPEVECGIREIMEETGFDISSRLIPDEFIQVIMNEQKMKLYLIRGVPENTQFVTQTRKEISKIEWHPIAGLPQTRDHPLSNKYYMVHPFVKELKAFVKKNKPKKKDLKQQQFQQQQQVLQDGEEISGQLKLLLGVGSDNGQQGQDSFMNPSSSATPVILKRENVHPFLCFSFDRREIMSAMNIK
eukprot:Nk52_evm5s639 gene=Nk52_evmTU5s639